jgi:hypothetical protein
MAGNRPNGGIGFSNNFEPQIGAPFDARAYAPSKADLYLAATWTANDGGIYVYNGMTVTVWDDAVVADRGIYILLDAINYATPASWIFVGGGSGQDIEIKDDGTSITAKVKDIDFVGAGVTTTGAGTANENITVTIPGGGSLNVLEDGTVVGDYTSMNFIGTGVQAEDSGTPGRVNVYVPPPTFAPYFNQQNSQGNAKMDTIAFPATPRISVPNISEGNPYQTGGWASTNKPSYTSANGNLTFTAPDACTGFSADATGDATITVKVYDAGGAAANVLQTFTTTTLFADGAQIGGANNAITVTISSYTQDTTKFKAKVSVAIQVGAILTASSYDGGRFHVEISMTTDTTNDTGTTYPYYGPNGTSATVYAEAVDVFFDTNPTTPSIAGTVTMVESTTPANILTKHLSGVEYYVDGSQFEINVNNINNYNANTQGRNGSGAAYNLKLADGVTADGDYNIDDLQQAPYSFGSNLGTWTNWNDEDNDQGIDWEYLNWSINNSPWRFRALDASVNAQVFDPWTNVTPLTTSANAAILIDTYNETGNSTTLREKFIDEQYRLIKGASAYTVWNSTTALGATISNQTSSGVSAGPFSDGCVVGSNLVRADKFFKDNGSATNAPDGGYTSLTGDLGPYKPNKSGTNPNYSTYTNTPTYHRLFEVASSNLNRPISGFELGFRGSFPTTGNAFDELVNNNLIVYIRKLQCVTTGTNIGATAVPHSLQNGNALPANATFNGSNYTNPPSAVDASNGSASARGTATAPTATSQGYYVISGSFGQSPTQCMNGFYIEVHTRNSAIRIDDIAVKFIFAAGSPATEGNASPPA